MTFVTAVARIYVFRGKSLEGLQERQSTSRIEAFALKDKGPLINQRVRYNAA
jgi:hypothetical protein